MNISALRVTGNRVFLLMP